MNKIFATATTALMSWSCFSGAAQAEVLSINGLTPAKSASFADIQSIAIGRFGGSDGKDLAFEVEDDLSAVTVFDQRYFDVIGGRSAVQPDATLSGSARAGVEEYETVEKRRRCVQRDADDKCISRKDIRVNCLKRVIDFRAQVRATRFSDGRNIYTESFPSRQEQTVCFGDDTEFASDEVVIRTMLSDAAKAIRSDLAPRQYRRDIRVLESRKGMTKPEGKFFKAAVKMTKRNAAEACRMWDEAAQNGMVHISLTFNRGLCAEQRGELDSAMALYREAQRQSSSKQEIGAAITRVSDHQRGLYEWDLRQSARFGGRRQ